MYNTTPFPFSYRTDRSNYNKCKWPDGVFFVGKDIAPFYFLVIWVEIGKNRKNSNKKNK